MTFQGAPNMLRAFGGSFIDALVASFPELSFDKSKFLTVPRMFTQLNTLIHLTINKGYHWSNTQNIKAWFDDFARTKGFNPLIAANWYEFSFKDISSAKGYEVCLCALLT